jgi:hypothetical protein
MEWDGRLERIAFSLAKPEFFVAFVGILLFIMCRFPPCTADPGASQFLEAWSPLRLCGAN